MEKQPGRLVPPIDESTRKRFAIELQECREAVSNLEKSGDQINLYLPILTELKYRMRILKVILSIHKPISVADLLSEMLKRREEISQKPQLKPLPSRPKGILKLHKISAA